MQIGSRQEGKHGSDQASSSYMTARSQPEKQFSGEEVEKTQESKQEVGAFVVWVDTCANPNMKLIVQSH